MLWKETLEDVLKQISRLFVDEMIFDHGHRVRQVNTAVREIMIVIKKIMINIEVGR